VVLTELLELALVGEHVEEHLLGGVRRKRVLIRNRHELAVPADHRRRGNLQVQVRALRLDDMHQRVVDVERHMASIDA
jgi:hypothetical protein